MDDLLSLLNSGDTLRKSKKVRLPVRILPGNQVLELCLDRDTTAGDIIDECLRRLADNTAMPEHECWSLVADLQGYEKRFTDSERLYQLIKKHILLAGNVEGVRFFLRRRKKRLSLCSVADGDDVLSPIHTAHNAPHKLLSSPTAADDSSVSTSTEIDARSPKSKSSGYSTDSETTTTSGGGGNCRRAVSKRRLYRPSSDMMPISEAPLRIAQPPPSNGTTAGYALGASTQANGTALPAKYGFKTHLNAMTYGELVQLAETQRRQLDSCQHELKHRVVGNGSSDGGGNGLYASVSKPQQQHHVDQNTLNLLRQQVQYDEQQLAKLRQATTTATIQATSEYQQLKVECLERERELREASSKVNNLRGQLDQLRQRRQQAREAAQQMQQRVTREKLLSDKQAELATVDSQIEQLMMGQQPASVTQQRIGQHNHRPQAAIEPFKVTPSSSSSRMQQQQQQCPKSMVVATVAHVTTTTVTSEQCVTKLQAGKGDRSSTSSAESSDTTASGTPPSVANYTSAKQRVSRSINQLLRDKMAGFDEPDGQQQQAEQQTTENSKNPLEPPDVIPTPDQVAVLSQTPAGSGAPRDVDELHLRNDTLRAAKRRSWAQHDGGGGLQGGTTDEAEHIRLVLRREQLKGRSHINFGFLFGSSKSTTLQQHEQVTLDLKQPQQKRPSPEKPSATESSVAATAAAGAGVEVREPPPYTPMLLPRVSVKKSTESSSDDGTSSSGSQSPRSIVVEQQPAASSGRVVKGILKPSNLQLKHKRRLRFDPLTLMLDAALEGDLQLVKQCAKQLPTVSVCNGEGISPLHNAVCAGHYDIVRFLVDNGADVNAQDTDGWTPIHCAASCNNLPMVKFLVERGACIFATTSSEPETALEKCEIEEDGYDGCSHFIYNIQDKMGRMCEGVVYAAYDYDAERDDELSMRCGDKLQVVERDNESDWWLCAHAVDGQQPAEKGYVPRSFLCLYPRIDPQCTLTKSGSGGTAAQAADAIDSMSDLRVAAPADMPPLIAAPPDGPTGPVGLDLQDEGVQPYSPPDSPNTTTSDGSTVIVCQQD